MHLPPKSGSHVQFQVSVLNNSREIAFKMFLESFSTILNIYFLNYLKIFFTEQS